MQYLRRAEVRVANRTIRYPDMNFDFVVEFNKDADIETVAQCTMYNLSDDTAKRINRVGRIIISAGYGDDIGTVFAGEINYIENSKQGTEKIVYIEAYDRSSQWLDLTVSKTYIAGTRASTIIDDLLETFGLSAGEYFLPIDYVYPRGRTFNLPLKDALGAVLADCRTRFNISFGQFYIGQPKGGLSTALSASAGLLSTPELIHDKDGIRHNVLCLLNHRLQPGSRVTIQSKSINGDYEVISGRHAKDADFVSELEVRKWPGS